MRNKSFKALLWVIILATILLGFIVFFIIKYTVGYRPSIYNYESYLAPKIINNIKKHYNYKEFKEINEFSQALYAEKAIAGIGSDFQAAQLIIDNKIKKINFEQIYGKNSNDWNVRKNLYRNDMVRHIEKFDKAIYDTIKKGLTNNKFAKILNNHEYDVDGDLKPDHFYEYILPYYSQDKGIAYNIDTNYRQHINPNGLNSKFNSGYFSFQQIFEILKEHNYQRFGWTNAYYDNLMIGSIFANKNPFNVFDSSNYKEAIDNFVKFVEEIGGHSIKDTEYNFFSGDGLELLNHLIESKEKRSDAAVLYNGDALDAYYSKDNFSSTKEGKIGFVRPKDNYLLMDCWVLSKTLNSSQTSSILDVLAKNIYMSNDINNLHNENKYIKDIFSFLSNKLTEKTIKEEIEKNVFTPNKIEEFVSIVKNADYSKIESILNYHNGNMFDDLFKEYFEETNLGEISNFDYVSYTPVDKLTYEFIKKWYFKNDPYALQIYEQPESNGNYNVEHYPIVNSNLRTKIASYYFEKTKS